MNFNLILKIWNQFLLISFILLLFQGCGDEDSDYEYLSEPEFEVEEVPFITEKLIRVASPHRCDVFLVSDYNQCGILRFKWQRSPQHFVYAAIFSEIPVSLNKGIYNYEYHKVWEFSSFADPGYIDYCNGKKMSFHLDGMVDSKLYYFAVWAWDTNIFEISASSEVRMFSINEPAIEFENVHKDYCNSLINYDIDDSK